MNRCADCGRACRGARCNITRVRMGACLPEKRHEYVRTDKPIPYALTPLARLHFADAELARELDTR